MTDWIEEKGKILFSGGKDSFADASRIASDCSYFTEDCEDELVCDDAVSCYNCRYRRWTQNSFQCVKRGDMDE